MFVRVKNTHMCTSVNICNWEWNCMYVLKSKVYIWLEMYECERRMYACESEKIYVFERRQRLTLTLFLPFTLQAQKITFPGKNYVIFLLILFANAKCGWTISWRHPNGINIQMIQFMNFIKLAICNVFTSTSSNFHILFR